MSNASETSPFDPMAMFAEARKRFGLDEADVNRAVAGLIPAFWAGMRHSAATPGGLQELMSAFTPPNFDKGSQAGVASADAFLQQVFPNDAIRQAVLDQVAATTGVGRDALAEMMPVAATMMMGSAARDFAVGPARDWLDAFMVGFARGRPKPPPTPAEMMAPFADAMNAFFSGFTPDTPKASAPETVPESVEAETVEPEVAEAGASGNVDAAAMSDMFTTGKNIQESQIRAFEQLFEAFAPGKSG